VQATGPGSGEATSAANSRSSAAADYLAIAKPANDRLDDETGAYARDAHRNLAARSDLLAEAAKERWCDQHLTKIPLPPPIAATARAMIRANQQRIALTERQARSMSLTEMASFTIRHKSLDAAV
jgi:hypothetical protein